MNNTPAGRPMGRPPVDPVGTRALEDALDLGSRFSEEQGKILLGIAYMQSAAHGIERKIADLRSFQQSRIKRAAKHGLDRDLALALAEIANESPDRKRMALQALRSYYERGDAA